MSHNLFIFCFVLLLCVVLVSLPCEKSVWKKRGRNLVKKNPYKLVKELSNYIRLKKA